MSWKTFSAFWFAWKIIILSCYFKWLYGPKLLFTTWKFLDLALAALVLRAENGNVFHPKPIVFHWPGLTIVFCSLKYEKIWQMFFKNVFHQTKRTVRKQTQKTRNLCKTLYLPKNWCVNKNFRFCHLNLWPFLLSSGTVLWVNRIHPDIKCYELEMYDSARYIILLCLSGF